MKNSTIPILTPPFSHFPQQKTPQRPSIRTPPFLAFALFTPRPLYLCTAPSTPSRLPRLPSVPFDSHPTFPTSDLHAPRLSRPSRFPLAENANRGPDCKENVPVWQKTPLGGLIRQEMQRPLDYIGKGSLLPRRKTAGQRIIHHELPQDAQNPNPATRPPSGVFCQMSPASPQCPLGSPSKQSDWRAFRAICPTSFPNDLPGVPPKPFYMLLMGTDKSEGRNAGDEFGNAYRNGPMMLARTGPPTSRHQPRRRPFPFSRKLCARFPYGWQKPMHERNGHERFLEQARRQTRKRPPQPSPTSIATRKEEPWARNTTEESEPTKGS